MACALALWIAVTAVPAAEPEKVADELGKSEYRVKVETILEPGVDFALYRVQVWTHGEQQVILGIDGGQLAVEGKSTREPGGVLHRTDFVLMLTVREHSEPQLRDKKRLLERRYLSASGGGITLSECVDSALNVKGNSNIQGGRRTQGLGEDTSLGKQAGQTLDVVARKPDPPRRNRPVQG